MKKVFQNPFIIVVMLCIFLVAGVLIGRHTMTSVIKLKENKYPEEPDSYQNDETVPQEFMIGDKIDINHAPAEAFAVLPGIGDILAERIVTYREENGPFQSVDDLLKVEGIGDSKLNAIREYLTVE